MLYVVITCSTCYEQMFVLHKTWGRHMQSEWASKSYSHDCYSAVGALFILCKYVLDRCPPCISATLYSAGLHLSVIWDTVVPSLQCRSQQKRWYVVASLPEGCWTSPLAWELRYSFSECCLWGLNYEILWPALQQLAWFLARRKHIPKGQTQKLWLISSSAYFCKLVHLLVHQAASMLLIFIKAVPIGEDKWY